VINNSHHLCQRFSGAYSFDPRTGLSARQETRLSLSSDGLGVYKGAESRENGWATVKTAASRILALKGHHMSARGKRSGVAAERRPGLPIDEIPIALKGRNRRRLVLFGCVFFDRSRHSMAHCEVPHGSPARSDIDDLVGPRPCILAFVAPFQGFMTRFHSQPRATQPLVELANACPGLTCCGPFRAIQFVGQTRITRVRAMEMPCRGRVKYNMAVIATF
jgi:hypothetical protein